MDQAEATLAAAAQAAPQDDAPRAGDEGPTPRRLFEAQAEGAARRRVEFGLVQRRDALRALRAAIKAREPQILAALQADLQKPEVETRLTEILPLGMEIRHALRHLPAWMRGSSGGFSLANLGTRARIRPQPRGTCLIISPWNYPFQLALGPLISALAAGNSAILKPSELAPATSCVIAELIADTFPPELVTVCEGGLETSQALLDLPFDHIFFTGSPQVGRVVMAAAAKHLSSVTLELGGKSPVIVGPEADLELAAKWIAFGKFVNAGQTCIAPDHLFVHEDVRAPLLDALRARIAATYASGGAASMAAIVNDRHAARLQELLRDATGRGARALPVGESEGEGEGRRPGATLLEALTPEMEIARKEIFGPILPVIPYRDLAEPIARINAGPKPLALYVFDRPRGEGAARIERVLSETSSGGAGVNLTLMQVTHPGLPFGGVNNSGLGASHGIHGFRAFSHERAVLENRLSAPPIGLPPYDGFTGRLAGWVERLLG